MPELLRLKTPVFELSIWTSELSTRLSTYHETLLKRGEASEETMLRFAPALQLDEVWLSVNPFRSSTSLLELNVLSVQAAAQHSLLLPSPVFFENTLYQFEWVFFQPIDDAYLGHRSRVVCDAFRFSSARSGIPARLTGSINMGNDVGWMRFPLCMQYKGNVQKQSFSFEVLPLKMVLGRELKAMYHTLDQAYPLWRFSLVQKTEQEVKRGAQRGDFPLMWLANFTQLRERFEQGLQVICRAPHRRLMPSVTHKKAARLKGRLSPKLSERVRQDLISGRYDRRYTVENKYLSVDTPENRFVKKVVNHCKNQLAAFEATLRSHNKAPNLQRFSVAFMDELRAWKQPMSDALNQSFLAEVGGQLGMQHESLVLQQKTGYSAVYQVWQQLRYYLDMFGDQSSISMRSVADIYELWCFLQIKHILEVGLGFRQRAMTQVSLSVGPLYEYELKEDSDRVFEFERADGVSARLMHEPSFTKGKGTIRSHTVDQRPDIVLEVTVPVFGDSQAPQRFIWVFDAKYRIRVEGEGETGNNMAGSDRVDRVPNDAINQLHRYRDALIRVSPPNESIVDMASSHKSRPVFGAFALYPGFFNQETERNPYAEAIAEVGIGAFALLPSMGRDTDTARAQNGHVWLRQFLESQIGPLSSSALSELAEQFYLQEAARIPYTGMRQTLYSDLVMTAVLGLSVARSQDYYTAFERGEARWYHMPATTFTAKFKQHVTEEIRYLALALGCIADIPKVWPVKAVTLQPRSALTVEQTGKASSSTQLYYLFELGQPLYLRTPITAVPRSPMVSSMRLTQLSLLEGVTCFSDLRSVYKEAIQSM